MKRNNSNKDVGNCTVNKEQKAELLEFELGDGNHEERKKRNSDINDEFLAVSLVVVYISSRTTRNRIVRKVCLYVFVYFYYNTSELMERIRTYLICCKLF